MRAGTRTSGGMQTTVLAFDGLLLLCKQIAVVTLDRVFIQELLQLGFGTGCFGGVSGSLVDMETVLLYLQLEARERAQRLPLTYLDVHRRGSLNSLRANAPISGKFPV